MSLIAPSTPDSADAASLDMSGTGAGPASIDVFDVLHAVGTPSPHCAAMLDCLPVMFEAAGSSVTVTLHEHLDISWCAEHAGSLVLIFVDAPARALLTASASVQAEAVTSALSRWQEVATQALKMAHQHPQRCVLVDVASLPGDIGRLFSELGLPMPVKPVDPRPVEAGRSDAVESILADRLAALDPSYETLYEDLRMSCRWPLALACLPSSAPDVMAALPAYRALVARCRELEPRAAEAESLLQQQELLMRQVHQLEETAASLHSNVGDLTRQEKNRAASAARLQALAQERETAMSDSRRRFQAIIQERETALEESRRRSQALAHEREVAWEEARRLQEQDRVRESACRLRTAGMELPLRADGMRLVGSVDTGDHRHLEFSLATLVVGSRTVSNLHLRLLQHLGRPGMALFATADGSPILGQWETHGEELGRAFMLVVPSDTRGEALLSRMGTTDWRLVRTLARAVALEISSGYEDLPTAWRTAASRLNGQLEALPARLRYDTLSAQAGPSDGPSIAIDVSMVDVLFGSTSLGDVGLRWWPSRNGSEGRLAMLARADAAELPMGSWPVQNGGLLEAEYIVPLGGRWSAAAWAALPGRDKEVLLCLLDALPEAARHAPDEAIPAGWTREGLGEAARQFNDGVRKTLRSVALRDRVSLLWRRATMRDR